MQKLSPKQHLTICTAQEDQTAETYEYVEFEATPIPPDEHAIAYDEPYPLADFSVVVVNERILEFAPRHTISNPRLRW